MRVHFEAIRINLEVPEIGSAHTWGFPAYNGGGQAITDEQSTQVRKYLSDRPALRFTPCERACELSLRIRAFGFNGSIARRGALIDTASAFAAVVAAH